MLEQWLREIPSPTWGKLDDAVKKIKLSTSPVSTDKGGNHGYYYNAQTRGVLILISAYRQQYIVSTNIIISVNQQYKNW